MKRFTFAAIRRTDYTNQIKKLHTYAQTEQQARAMLVREYVLVLVGRLEVRHV